MNGRSVLWTVSLVTSTRKSFVIKKCGDVDLLFEDQLSTVARTSHLLKWSL